MEIIPAGETQLPAIEEMMNECIHALSKAGIYQWDANYPNRQTFQNGIDKDQLYILVEQGEVLGIVIINSKQNTGWDAIPWTYNQGVVLAVHSLAISPKHQGKGYGKKLLHFCEEHAKTNGYHTIRLDVFSENRKANSLYANQGYHKAGEITYSFKPEGHQLYYCYEKKM